MSTIQSAILAHGHSQTYTLRQICSIQKLPYKQAHFPMVMTLTPTYSHQVSHAAYIPVILSHGHDSDTYTLTLAKPAILN